MFCSYIAYVRKVRDSLDNAVEENSSVFSLIWMRRLLSAGACGQRNIAPTKLEVPADAAWPV